MVEGNIYQQVEDLESDPQKVLSGLIKQVKLIIMTWSSLRFSTQENLEKLI